VATFINRFRAGTHRLGQLVLFLGVFGLLLPRTAPAADAPERLDILVRNVRVIDGTGKPEFRADVGIRQGRIVSVGKVETAANETIDGTPYLLCPGFIDLHNHGDHGILSARDAENFVRQGTTTLVCGNCGSSPADVPAFFRQLRDGGSGVNIVLLIGHGSVRQAVIGDRDAAPTADQLRRMREMVRQAMEAGAVGMSSGLRYRPGAYATTDEVAELAKEIAPYGGFYATHMRDEGPKILEALDEALLIGQRASVPVHISHHKVSSASVWGLTTQTLARIDKARAAGMDVTLDQYPYRAGSSYIGLMVPQPMIAGGPEAFRKRIADADVRQKVLAAVEAEMAEKLYEPGQKADDAQATAAALTRIQLARSPGNKALEGKNLAEILADRKIPLSRRAGAELIIELVGQGASAIYHTIDDRAGGDLERVLQHPQTCVASDGSVFPFGEQHPHPRSYGTYPRVFALYVRERKLLSWEQAVHKMTGLPARRLGWTDRGTVKAGSWADLVLLRPEEVADPATFANPHRYAVGIEHVIVRGEFVLRSGKMTGKRPGRPVCSVPVAATSAAQLRRDLLEILGRPDGRFGLYAQSQDGRQVVAINADDPFPVAAADGVDLPGPAVSLRELTRRLADAKKETFAARPKPDASQRHLVVYERLPLSDGRAWHLVIGYDRLSGVSLENIDELIRGPLRSRIVKYDGGK
jgi:N-acyl-D-amino-acid deacylase